MSARDYMTLIERQKQLASDVKAYKERFGSMVNEEPGEYKIEAGKYDVHVKRAEKYEWDQDRLEELSLVVSGVTKSPFENVKKAIDVSFSVDKKKYLALATAEKTVLSSALTRKPGATTIKVTLAGEETDDDTSV